MYTALRTDSLTYTSTALPAEFDGLRIVQLSDLHNREFGKNNQRLYAAVKQAAPDLIFLTGDLVDEYAEAPIPYAKAVGKALSAIAPTYYVTGNHEWWSGEAERICDHMEALGVHVLRGDAMTMELNGEKITFCGIDDPDSGESGQQLSQLEKCDKGDTFTILLAHRPEEITSYLDGAYDLILSGHAHGGQWRIPGILNGLYAPNQGLFPSYAGGQYFFDGTVFLVSRGLARESTRIPRIFNRPEVVVADLVPKSR